MRQVPHWGKVLRGVTSDFQATAQRAFFRSIGPSYNFFICHKGKLGKGYGNKERNLGLWVMRRRHTRLIVVFCSFLLAHWRGHLFLNIVLATSEALVISNLALALLLFPISLSNLNCLRTDKESIVWIFSR